MPKGVYPRESAKQRFQKYIKPSGECHEWTGAKTHSNYGRFQLEGKAVRAHRYAWYLHYGYWPKKDINHLCNNRICVNPHHLEEVSAKENSEYMTMCDRQLKGTQIWKAKLDESKILEIRKKHSTGESYRKLAKEYGVARRTIWTIVSNRTWKHV